MAQDSEIQDINWSEPFDATIDLHIKTEESENIPDDCIKLLLDSFGHSKFRKMQWKIISSILYEKRDNCVIMATGYGKSLCFQFPSVYRNTITLVVSPLISLMQDQVTAMCFYNLKACFLGSAQTNRDTVYEVIDRQYNIVYVTPEYITSESGSFLIGRIKDDLSLIAIDEAHCISKWGHDFRSAYRNLNVLREWCPAVPILAMTATATTKVRDDIIKSLDLRNPQIISTGFDRPNLEFIVKPKTECWSDIGEHIKNVKIGSIIVYCITRRITEEVASVISSHGFPCGVYHAGLPLKHRNKIHDEFIHDRIRVVVATIAFGMGINKPDVRLVIHYGVSKDIEGYYQEVGRAGRDGLPAKCLLFHRPKDWALHRMIRQRSKPETSIEQMEKLMRAIREYIEIKDCRRRFILNYFQDDCKNLIKRPDCCDNCKRAISSPKESINLYGKYQGLDVDGRLDITEDSKLLLRLLQDMNSRFGLRKAILVLRGSKSKDVPAAYNHHFTYGKLKHRSDKWIQAVVNSLVELNILTMEEVHDAKFSYTKCVITSKGKVWLSGILGQVPIKFMPNDEFIKLLNPRVVSAPKITFPLLEKKEQNQPSTSAKPSVTPAPSIILAKNTTLSSPSINSDIYRPLLKVRSKLASLFDVMPYLVASTKALEQLAKIQPTTMEEFRNIRLDGYSEEKTQRFGPVFLKVIRDHQAKFKKTTDPEKDTEKLQETLENTDPGQTVIKQEPDVEASNDNPPSQAENEDQSLVSTQESVKIIDPEPQQIIEIESDIENAIFADWDSDDSELTQVGKKVEQQLNASVSKPSSNENIDLDLLIDALQEDELKEKKTTENLKQPRTIDKKSSNTLDYESDDDLFNEDWDLEIDESDLTMISQQAEDQFKNDCGQVTASTSNASSIDSMEQKLNDVTVKLEVSCSDIYQNNLVKKERKPRIIEKKVTNAFEYEDDSDSDTESKPITSPKKRALPSWMQVSQKKKR
ncbi:bifunctional 3'-5' exonuclease/ATP-dependent helicase WRN-like [Episyrphus balteatus]|uniref:bifunctional 3'-5' exonuclease/ATP-dependent helicase WRN-like n=1 Tax=Episyrphus balteatus TaxID=286459 RepID=UPI00248644F7|nr:bifunctional 3'-5' exonuclease/ATP-dependent helicase WRN-like [Episyrphus balteatus]